VKSNAGNNTTIITIFLEVIRQIFWNINVPKTVFCEFLPKFQYGRLFFDVVRIGQMHIALVHTVRVFIQCNTLL